MVIGTKLFKNKTNLSLKEDINFKRKLYIKNNNLKKYVLI